MVFIITPHFTEHTKISLVSHRQKPLKENKMKSKAAATEKWKQKLYSLKEFE